MYNGLIGVDIPQGSASFVCDVLLDPGGSLMVRLVDTSGKPVTTARVTGRLPDSIDRDSGMSGESVAEVAGLEPGKPTDGRRPGAGPQDRRLAERPARRDERWRPCHPDPAPVRLFDRPRGRRDGYSGRRFYPGQSRPHRQAVSR